MAEHLTIRQQLQQMADEIRVKAHLAGMEAKDKWNGLEPRLHAYEQKAEGAVGKVAEELVSVGNELKDDLSKFLEHLKARVDNA